MAATRALLFLFISFLLLFTLYWFTPLFHHHSNDHQSFEDRIGVRTVFRSNQNEPESESKTLDRKVDSFPPSYYDNHFNTCYPKPKPWSLLDDKDVVGLSENNFSDFMAKNKYVLVMYYATWCNWSHELAPEYAAAAKMLKGEAVLAMVDSWEYRLQRTYHVDAYPTIHLFVNGARQYAYDPDQERSRDAITTWVKSKIALGIYNITTVDEAERILTDEFNLVLGFFDSLESAESEELVAASKLQNDINFYQTASADVAEIFLTGPRIRRPALIFLKPVAGNYSLFDGQFNRLAIAEFLSQIKLPLMITVTLENAYRILQNPMKQLWLFAPTNCPKKIISAFEEAAEAFEGKLLFVYAETNSEGFRKRISGKFDVTGDAPRIITYRDYDDEKYVLNGELTLSSIKSFGKNFLQDKLFSPSEFYPDSETLILKQLPHSGALFRRGFDF